MLHELQNKISHLIADYFDPITTWPLVKLQQGDGPLKITSFRQKKNAATGKKNSGTLNKEAQNKHNYLKFKKNGP